jgi:hypothetical protein
MPYSCSYMYVINASYLEECTYSMLIILREWRQDWVIYEHTVVERYAVVQEKLCNKKY